MSALPVLDIDLPPDERPARIARVADLMCGAGGSSLGAKSALKELGLRMRLVVVNHWQIAISTHQVNFPDALHFCQDVETLRPIEAVPEGMLDLLMASPTCTHHSQARGGRPTSDQQRADPWHILPWLTQLHVKRILIENVPEYVKWGPVDPSTGRPIKGREGEYFRAWIAALQALGFVVEWKFIVCANYGDATTRKRFFLIGRSDGRKLRWQEFTHAKDATDGLSPWRTAREIIDWSTRGRSIYGRPQPLAPNTLLRIRAGLAKQGARAEPWLPRLDREIARAKWYRALSQQEREAHRTAVRAAEEPSPEAGKRGAVEVDGFIVKLRGTSTVASADAPLPAATAGGTHLALVEAMLIGQHGGSVARPVTEPVMAVATKGAIALAEPVVTPFYGPKDGRARAHGVDRPLATITGDPRFALAEPIITPYYGHGSGESGKSVDLPLDAATGKARFALVEPFIMGQCGEQRPRSVEMPLPTVMTVARIGLVMPHPDDTDILFRMITNDELAAAMSLEEDGKPYEFTGNQVEITRQIGNACPRRTIKALVRGLMAA